MKNRQERRLHTAAVFLFLIYILLLAYFLFFSEGYGRTMKEQEYRYNLRLFQEIRRFWVYRHTLGWKTVFINLFGNVVAFMPFGFLLPLLMKKHGKFWTCTFLSALFSLSAEALQLYFKVGAFDVDDLVLNTIGGMAGYVLYRFVFLRFFDRKSVQKEEGV